MIPAFINAPANSIRYHCDQDGSGVEAKWWGLVNIHPALPVYSKDKAVKSMDWYNEVCRFKVYL